jgi:catechol 2,3-dioxygenase
MLNFYVGTLGMDVIHATSSLTHLGVDGRVFLILDHRQIYPLETHTTQGLYHVAFLLPSRQALGEILRQLIEKQYPLAGLVDHGVSEAIYLSDPEGNGVELYCDRPVNAWPTVKGQLAMVNAPFQHQAVFALSTKASGLAKRTILGHLHLHVRNLSEAEEYYTHQFAYQLQQRFGSQASFLSDGDYHHHLGINIWLGTNLPKKNLFTTGLRGYQIVHLQSKPDYDVIGVELY